MSRRPADKMDAGPILRAIDAAGGMRQLLIDNGYVVENQVAIENPVRRGKRGFVKTKSEATPIMRRWDSRIKAARERGVMSLYYIDEAACTLLGVHPMVYYGQAWLLPEDRVAA